MLKNLKIFHKITLLSIILLLFSCIIGFTGYYYTQNSNNNLSKMYNDDMKAINVLDDVRIQSRTCQYDLLNLILSIGNKENQDKFATEMDTKLKGINNDITVYKALNLDQDELDTIATLEASFPQYNTVCKKIRDMTYSGNISSEEIYVYLYSNQDLLDGLRSGANGLLKTHMAKADDTYTITQNANQKSLKILSIILIIATTLGIILTILIVKPITSSLTAATNYLGIIATGDFTKTIPLNLLKNKDEVGGMLKAIDKMQQSIREVLVSVINESSIIKNMIANTENNMSKLSYEMQDVSATTEQLSAGMQETAASTEQMNAASLEIQEAIENIACKAKESALSSNDISNRANEIKTNAITSQKNTDKVYSSTNKNLRDAIEKSKSVEQIKVLSDAILQVTSETNLLALNAAIEAARAGDAGKGFAVVADEIRKLAEDSKNTVNEIQNITQIVLTSVENLALSSREILEFVDVHVKNDYNSMVTTGETYNKDAENIYNLSTNFSMSTEQIGKLMENIVAALNGITLSTSEGAEGTSHIAEKTTSVVEMVTDITTQTTNIKNSADTLSSLISKFKI